MSKKDDTLKSRDRRKFFRTAGSSVVGVAALGLAAPAAVAAEQQNDGRETAGYQETEHVKTAYRTARF
jgi:hypothetical protein